MTYEEAVQAMNDRTDVYSLRRKKVVLIYECVKKHHIIGGEEVYAYTYESGHIAAYNKPIDYLKELIFLCDKEGSK